MFQAFPSALHCLRSLFLAQAIAAKTAGLCDRILGKEDKLKAIAVAAKCQPFLE